MTRIMTTTIAVAAGIAFLTAQAAAQAAPPGFGFGGVGGKAGLVYTFIQ